MALITRPLSSTFGVEVSGLDPRGHLTDIQKEEMRHLLEEHQLLLFRGQQLDADTQIDLLSAFGPVCDEGNNGLHYELVSNVDKSVVRQGRLLFHQDYAFTPWPLLVNSLHAIDLSGDSAPTIFASCLDPVRDLSDDERLLLSRLNGVHVHDWTPTGKTTSESVRVRLADVEGDISPALYPRAAHPVIKDHPRTGEPLLFISEYFTSHLEGLEDEDSEEIIRRCYAYLYKPENLYVHQWVLGDLIVWDNIALQHARGPAVPNSRRTLRRVIVSEHSLEDCFAAAGSVR